MYNRYDSGLDRISAAARSDWTGLESIHRVTGPAADLMVSFLVDPDGFFPPIENIRICPGDLRGHYTGPVRDLDGKNGLFAVLPTVADPSSPSPTSRRIQKLKRPKNEKVGKGGSKELAIWIFGSAAHRILFLTGIFLAWKWV